MKMGMMLREVLAEAGFIEDRFFKNMYATSHEGEIIRIFSPSFIRKMGNVRFDGYIGLYFSEFEKQWRESKKDNSFYRADLPSFGISISNFPDFSDSGIFKYTTNRTELVTSANHIYEKCNSIPSDALDFVNCIKMGKIIDKNISEYINVYDNSYENNPYLIKIANLFRWISKRYLLSENIIQSILNRYQASAIDAVPDKYYYVN